MRSTFGVPGTGLSWSSSTSTARTGGQRPAPGLSQDNVVRKKFENSHQLAAFIQQVEAGVASAFHPETGRRISVSQLAANHRAMVAEEKRKRGEQAISEEERRYNELRNSWRTMTPTPTAQYLESQLALRPFGSAGEPLPPDRKAARAREPGRKPGGRADRKDIFERESKGPG
jgi:hypothetical protein